MKNPAILNTEELRHYTDAVAEYLIATIRENVALKNALRGLDPDWELLFEAEKCRPECLKEAQRVVDAIMSPLEPSLKHALIEEWASGAIPGEHSA